MTLKIISAEQIVYQGAASAVTLPGAMGLFTVLQNHAPLVSTLTAGNIEYVDENNMRQSQAIGGGLVDVDDNVVSVCLF